MTQIYWNALKSKRLKMVRGVSFEEMLQMKLVKIREHPTQPHQRIMLYDYKGYIWAVISVGSEREGIFLKTMYPSRKYTKQYEKGEL